jgi:hypothetical protein
MRLRAILSVLLFLQLSPAAQKPVSPGKERWPIKTSLPAGADLNKPGVLIPLSDFLMLPNPPGVKTNEARYQAAHIPKAEGAKFSEGQIVRTKGYIRLVAGEPDGDYHIQVSETPDTFDNCLVVEVPKDDPEFVANSPEVLAAAKIVRDFVKTRMLAGGDPTGRVLIMIHPPFVEVTGQLFFDDAHVAQTEKGIYRGKSIHKRQLPSKTVWEIHPVTKMEFSRVPR